MIRRSHDRLIFNTGISIPVKTVFILRRGGNVPIYRFYKSCAQNHNIFITPDFWWLHHHWLSGQIFHGWQYLHITHWMCHKIYRISQEICTRFLLCCALLWLYISIRLTSLALWQSNDCPSASKATRMNMDTYFMWIHYEGLHNHNKANHNKTVRIFLGIYCSGYLSKLFVKSACIITCSAHVQHLIQFW